jgi:hypothetical protein
MLKPRSDDSPEIVAAKRRFNEAAGPRAGALFSIYESAVDVMNREGENRIRARYDLGRCFNNAARLGAKSLSALAAAIDRPHSFVREHRIVAERIDEDELADLTAIRDGAGFGLDWMHIVALAVGLPDKRQRRRLAQRVAAERLSVDALALTIRASLGHLTSDPSQGGGRPFAVPKTLPALIYKAKQQTGSAVRYLSDVLAPNLSDLVKDTPPDKLTPEVAALMREFHDQLAGLREMLDSIEPQLRAQVEHVEASAASDGPAVIDVEAVVVGEPGRGLILWRPPLDDASGPRSTESGVVNPQCCFSATPGD